MKEKEVEKQERVIILIDGSNFYYSTAKKGKKIDFNKLIKELTGDRKLVRAYYYVAPLDIEANEKKYWSHQRFLDKLRQIPNFEVVLCALKKIKSCEKYVYVVKGDDVKMSNTLIMGAVDNSYDTAIVVSGDEDFIDSINIVKKRYMKRIENAYFSKSSSSNLRDACDFAINLNKIINKLEVKKSPELSEDHAGH
ncbi:MAG: NYN domain-containing protein [Nanoarchaeota archaeon]|nr:NYN domain-containing protein [Nanoarchaeota archaeon]